MEPVRQLRREPDGSPTSAPLATLRERIDRVDDALLAALAERYRLAEEVGALKGKFGIPALDSGREAEIVLRASQAARAEGIPEEGVREIYWAVLEYCRDGVRRSRIEQIRESGRVAADG